MNVDCKQNFLEVKHIWHRGWKRKDSKCCCRRMKIELFSIHPLRYMFNLYFSMYCVIRHL